jgi:hypothetical protein
MAILVVCPGCRKQFQVGDQFGGRTGPCPHCKTPIKIPTKEEEVKIHAPEAFTPRGKSAKGRPILKPVARTDTEFRPQAAALVCGAAIAVFLVVFLCRGLIRDSSLLQALALLIVSPPLVIGGYFFLRDDELEPYRGKPLYIRAGIIAIVYVVLWFVFGRLVRDQIPPGELWLWLVTVAPFIVVGGSATLVALDLDFGSSVLLYSFYLLMTIALAGAAGVSWIWFFIAATP